MPPGNGKRQALRDGAPSIRQTGVKNARERNVKTRPCVIDTGFNTNECNSFNLRTKKDRITKKDKHVGDLISLACPPDYFASLSL